MIEIIEHRLSQKLGRNGVGHERIKTPAILTKIDAWPPLSHRSRGVTPIAKQFTKCRRETISVWLKPLMLRR
ncbi:hypothetical protein [Methylovirgula ligni]|uniref:hypothetical protein n=1 Tax=Methylovirgula ligni TaxID=569860 RepID=UPI001AECD94E|nr:hypothetical protein [Methylovirgula ligni]